MNEHGPAPGDARVECRSMSVRRGDRVVLRDITFTLCAGECLTLIGPNGSGKTTLLLAMLGLLRPAAGLVCLNGLPAHRLAARRRGRFAAYVPQLVERIPAFRVYDVVAGGRYPHVSPLQPLSESDRTAISQALDQCGLTTLAEREINAISAGERQKALIAAALAQDAEFLFLDEPNTALDPAYQVELVGLLRSWHARGRGLVLISHELNLPLAVGGHVVALREGRIVADGPAAEILQPQTLAAVYHTTFEVATTPGGRRFVLPRWSRDERVS